MQKHLQELPQNNLLYQTILPNYNNNTQNWIKKIQNEIPELIRCTDYDSDDNDSDDDGEDDDPRETPIQQTKYGCTSRQLYCLSADQLGEWTITSKKKGGEVQHPGEISPFMQQMYGSSNDYANIIRHVMTQ